MILELSVASIAAAVASYLTLACLNRRWTPNGRKWGTKQTKPREE